MFAVKAMNLTKKYDDTLAVDQMNLQIARGETFALLGVNGAGKTTAIKMLTCLSRPTFGDALIGGCSILRDAQSIKRMIGVSPQETAVAPQLTVLENLQLMCGIHGLSPEKQKAKILQLAAQFHLQDILSKKAGKLSGGWQRRLSIAMALVSDPDVLFLDEPTLGLDVIARSELWEEILSLKGRVTIILTTHYMEEAYALADRIGVMKGGRLLSATTAQELISMTGADTFENAFIAVVREGKVCV